MGTDLPRAMSPSSRVNFSLPKLLNYADILASQTANAIKIALSHGLRFNQLATNAKTAGPGLQEFRGGRQIDSAGGHETNLRQRPAHSPEKSRPHDIGREYLDD